MPSFKFICEHRDFHTYDLDSKNTLETNKESLYDVIEEFERFLKGAGFVFDGKLDIVNDEPSIKLDDLASSEDYVHWNDINMNSFEQPPPDLFEIGNLDYLGNIEYIGNLDFSGNNDFVIQPQSTAWPFPENERP